MKLYGTFKEAIRYAENRMLDTSYPIQTEKWQGIKLENPMRETLFVSFQCVVKGTLQELEEDIKPNLPWTQLHFFERVGGIPLNPGETYKIWPYYKRDSQMRTENEKFSHTYMERIWPKYATNNSDNFKAANKMGAPPNHGIRYQYGDMNSLLMLLKKEPYTRQAYLPIWFPEDTGAEHGGRVPCTLGYHFIRRGGFLHVAYYIRSCDFRRHFRDDIYLTIRKMLWIIDELKELDKENWENVKPGIFTMHITSLHCFESDFNILKKNQNG